MKKIFKGAQPQTLGLIHLGCPKNQVDSEEMLAVLALDGWTLVGNPDDADVLVINTCGFIDAAKEESIQAIRDAVRKKKRGRCRKVVVAGCLAQRYALDLADEFPGVDAVIGLGHTAELPNYVRSTFEGERPVISTPPPPEWQEIGGRLMTTPPWTAYLKIGEGCSHKCSFCAIPLIRGNWRSRPPELLIDEVKKLTNQGLKEAILIGQDTTLYGVDLRESPGENWGLPRLVRELGKIDGLRWQRIMYAHPGRVSNEIVDLFGKVDNLAAYIDVPFQHGDDAVLKRMKRAGSAERYLEIVSLLRRQVPRIAIRSTFLVGFPGETQSEFERLCEFVKAAQLDHAGVFVYSPEDTTSAFEMTDTVPRETAEERAAEMMRIQAEISKDRLARLVGLKINVLVENKLGTGKWLARSERDAPEVDGSVTLLTNEAKLGDIVQATVTDSSVHDLIAVPAAGHKTDTLAMSAGI